MDVLIEVELNRVSEHYIHVPHFRDSLSTKWQVFQPYKKLLQQLAQTWANRTKSWCRGLMSSGQETDQA